MSTEIETRLRAVEALVETGEGVGDLETHATNWTGALVRIRDNPFPHETDEGGDDHTSFWNHEIRALYRTIAAHKQLQSDVAALREAMKIPIERAAKPLAVKFELNESLGSDFRFPTHISPIDRTSFTTVLGAFIRGFSDPTVSIASRARQKRELLIMLENGFTRSTGNPELDARFARWATSDGNRVAFFEMKVQWDACDGATGRIDAEAVAYEPF